MVRTSDILVATRARGSNVVHVVWGGKLAPAGTRLASFRFMTVQPRSCWMIAVVALATGAALALLAAVVFAWDREAVLAWKQSASPLLFFAAMSILPAIGLPLTPFYVIAGATFGVPAGLLGSMLALTTNLSLCYVVARHIPRTWLEGVLERFGAEFPTFEQTSGAIRFSLLVKLTPGVPMLVKNHLLGLSGVPFNVYLGTSVITSMAYAVPLMLLGSSLFEHSRRTWAVGLLLLVISAATVYFWRRSRP